MRVLLTVVGSRSDIQPMVALAAAFARAGHGVTLAASPNGRDDAARAAVPFVSLGPDVEAFIRQHADKSRAHPIRLLRALEAAVSEELTRQLDGLAPLAAEHDALVAAGLAIAGSSLAEALRLPFFFVAYQPQAFRSSYHPPMGVSFQEMPRLANRIAWSAVTSGIDRMVLAPLNRIRARLELPVARDALACCVPPARSLLAADPELSLLPADVTTLIPATGAFTLPDLRPLGADLESFLAPEDRPVYLGFTGAQDTEPEATTALLAEAVQAAGCRGVLATGASAPAPLTAGVLGIGDVPLGSLFARTRAVVHQGNAATTALAARAGVPQVIVPHALDQFAWGRQAHRLGIAPAPLPRDHLSVSKLTIAIAACLSDTTMQAKAKELGATLSRRDGAGAAVAEIVRLSGARS